MKIWHWEDAFTRWKAADGTVRSPSGGTPLVTNAGVDQSVDEGNTVNLSGSATGGTAPYTFTWTVADDGGTGLTTGDLTGANTTTPSFTAPQVTSDTAITIQLSVTDSAAMPATDVDTVVITSTNEVTQTFDTEFYIATTGNDTTGDGGSGTPWATLDKALTEATALSGQNVRINMAAGIYRDSTQFTTANSAAEVVIEGDSANPRNVEINGGQVYNSWTLDQGNTYYTTATGYKTGSMQAPNGTDTGLKIRRELVVADGVLLQQRSSLTDCRNNVDSYYRDDGQSRMYINIGENPAGNTIEIAHEGKLLNFTDCDNITVRGLTIRVASGDYTNPVENMVQFNRCSSWKIEDCILEQSNNKCLQISGDSRVSPEITYGPGSMSRVTVSEGGNSNMGLLYVHELMFTDCKFNDNGFRTSAWRTSPEAGAGYGQGSISSHTGDKWLSTRDLTFIDCTWERNKAAAVWFDNDSQDILFRRCGFYDGLHWDTFLERCWGPFTFQGCEWFDGSIGLHPADCGEQGVTGLRLEDDPETGNRCVLAGPYYNTLLQPDRDHNGTGTDVPWTFTSNHDGVSHSANDYGHSWENVLFYIDTVGQWRGHAILGSDGDQVVWDNWLSRTGVINNNEYRRNAANANANIVRPSHAGLGGWNTEMTFAQWQSASGKDANSISTTGSKPVRRYVEDFDAELHVATTGNDTSGDGSFGSPYRTMEKAVTEADTLTGQNVKVKIANGTYREICDIDNLANDGGWSSLTIEGNMSTVGAVTYSGSEIYSSWTQDSGDTYYTTGSFVSGTMNSNPPGYDVAAPEAELGIRMELVVVSGSLLRQRLSLTACRNNVESYYYDSGTGRMYVHTAGGPSGKTIEIGERKRIIRISDLSNVTFRGITFENCASDWSGTDGDSTIRILLSHFITFDTCVFKYSNTKHLNIGTGVETDPTLSTNHTIKDCVIEGGGIMNLNIKRSQDITLLRTKFNDNGWRCTSWRDAPLQGNGYNTATHNYTSNSGGDKHLYTSGWTITDCTYEGNRASAIWFDFDCGDITFTRCGWYDGLHWDVFLERSHGPFTFNGCEWFDGSIGVNIGDADDVTFQNDSSTSNNCVAANYYNAMIQPGRDDSSTGNDQDYTYTSIHDGLSKNNNDRNHSWTNMLFYINTVGNYIGYAVVGAVGGTGFPLVWDNWISRNGTINNNEYRRNASNANNNIVRNTYSTPTNFSFAGWQTESGKDASSTSVTGSKPSRRYI